MPAVNSARPLHPTWHPGLLALLLLWALGCLAPALAQTHGTTTSDVAAAKSTPLAGLAARLSEMAQSAAPAGSGLRVAVELGQLDPRLKLAPCARIEPSLPTGARLWGRTRVGLHCASGPVAWRAWLPVEVRIWGPGPVAARPLAAGTTLQAGDLTLAEVEYTAAPEPPAAAARLAGRQLARALSAGDALREADLRQRIWFQGGDTVRVVALGEGWAVSTEGIAENPGVDGRPVRVRTGPGRTVEGRAVGPKRVELVL